MSKIRLKTKLSNNEITVKTIISHPMDTGRKKDAEGQIIPKHFIKKLSCYHNNELVLDADWGTGVSKNPYLSFIISNGASGDTVTIKWLDNLNQSRIISGEILLKKKKINLINIYVPNGNPIDTDKYDYKKIQVNCY